MGDVKKEVWYIISELRKKNNKQTYLPRLGMPKSGLSTAKSSTLASSKVELSSGRGSLLCLIFLSISSFDSRPNIREYLFTRSCAVPGGIT